MTIAATLEAFPPVLCRLLARKKRGRPFTAAEIAERSALSVPEVLAISQCTNWKGIQLLDAFAFLRGCSLDIDDSKAWRRVRDYVARDPNFEYLRCSPEWASYYLPLLTRWRKSYGEVNPGSPLWPGVRALLIRLNSLLAA